MKRVLWALDLSDVSVGLLKYAHAIVHWYGGCPTAVHVVPDSPTLRTHFVVGDGLRREGYG